MIVLCLLLAGPLLFAEQGHAAGETGEAGFAVQVPDATLSSGSETSIAVDIQSAHELYGFDLKMTYDDTRFEIVSVALNPAFGRQGQDAMLYYVANNGLLSVVGVRLGQDSGMSGDHNLVTIRVKALGLNGTASLVLTADSNYSDYDEKSYKLLAPIARAITVTGGTDPVTPPPPPAPQPPRPGIGGGGAPGGGAPAGGPQEPAKPNEPSTVTRLDLDADWLAEQRKNGDRLVVQAPENVGGRLEIRLPLAALADGGERAALSVESPSGAYTLPLQLLRNGGAADAGSQVLIVIEKAGLALAERMKTAAAAVGADLLVEGVHFQVWIEKDGASIPFTDFGSTYVERSLPLPSSYDAKRITGVWYDTDAAKFRFVPTRIVAMNGEARAMLRRPGNSVYAVAALDRQFADLEGHWAKADVELLASKLILNGMTPETFGPELSVTRAQFATMLVQALSLAEAADAAAFTDVGSGDWYAGAVGSAVKAGLIAGYTDGSFQPDRNITREEMAVIAARAMAFAGGEPSPAGTSVAGFGDAADIADWAADAVALVSDAGVMGAMPDGRFSGREYASRAQAAVVLKRLLQTVDFIE